MKKFAFGLLTALGLSFGAFAQQASTYVDLEPATQALSGMKSEVTTWISANSSNLIWFLTAFLFLVLVYLMIKLFSRGTKTR